MDFSESIAQNIVLEIYNIDQNLLIEIKQVESIRENQLFEMDYLKPIAQKLD